MIFRFSLTKACCVFSLESPHRGDSNEYTQHAIINIKKKITLNYPKYDNVCSYGIFSLGTQEQVRNSRGKRAISVWAIEVLLYLLHQSSSLWCPCLSWSRDTGVEVAQWGGGWAHELICRLLLPHVCSYCVSWKGSVSVAWKGLLVACRDLQISFFLSNFRGLVTLIFN